MDVVLAQGHDLVHEGVRVGIQGLEDVHPAVMLAFVSRIASYLA